LTREGFGSVGEKTPERLAPGEFFHGQGSPGGVVACGASSFGSTQAAAHRGASSGNLPPKAQRNNETTTFLHKKRLKCDAFSTGLVWNACGSEKSAFGRKNSSRAPKEAGEPRGSPDFRKTERFPGRN
jgi:hypothetical protein